MLPIKDYDNLYAITEDCKVFSYHTNIYLKPFLDNKGYFRVTLYKEGKPKTFLLHRLYAIAYLPTKDTSLSINHKDGNKLNNSLANLEWLTIGANTKHAYRLGLNSSKGSKNNNSKLSEESAAIIRESGKSNRELATMFSVHITTIQKIKKGKLRPTTNDCW